MDRRPPLIRHALVALALCLAAAAASLAVGAPAATAAEPGERADVRFPADGASMALARRVADEHWGAVPCGGDVGFAWTALAPGTNATASWSNPTDAWGNAAENFDCRISFNPGASFDWPKLCTVMVHEVGHLLGRRHAEDSSDVMAAFYARPLPVCEQTPDPTAPAPAPPPAPQPAPASPPATQHARGVLRTTPSAGRLRSSRARRAMRCRVARRILGARRAARSRLRCPLPGGPRRAFRRR